MGKEARRERREDEKLRGGLEEGFSEADKRFAGTLNYLARGIIIGGSLGAIAAWFVPGVQLGRMIFLGLLCGCLAGVTMKNRADRRGRR